MIQIKMRPIFSRGNSVASISVVNDKAHQEEQQQQQVQRTKPRRCRVGLQVRFSDDVVEIPAVAPLTERERKSYFYNIDDLGRFNRDRALTALMYTRRNLSGIPWDDNEHSVRGLEEAVRKNHTTQRERREHVRAVLREQERLRLEGLGMDAFLLAEASSKSSAKAKAEALALAREDAATASRFAYAASLMSLVRGKLSALREK